MEMPLKSQVEVKFEVYGSKPQSGKITVRCFNPKQRLARAARFWGGAWLAAIGFLFIPVLHFILVPTALVTGPVLFFRIMKQKDLVLEGNGVCPKCNSFVSVAPQELDWPLQQSCAGCAALMIISNAQSAKED